MRVKHLYGSLVKGGGGGVKCNLEERKYTTSTHCEVHVGASVAF